MLPVVAHCRRRGSDRVDLVDVSGVRADVVVVLEGAGRRGRDRACDNCSFTSIGSGDRRCVDIQ